MNTDEENTECHHEGHEGNTKKIKEAYLPTYNTEKKRRLTTDFAGLHRLGNTEEDFYPQTNTDQHRRGSERTKDRRTKRPRRIIAAKRL